MSKIGVNTGKIFEQLFDPVLPVQGYRILTKDECPPSKFYAKTMPLNSEKTIPKVGQELHQIQIRLHVPNRQYHHFPYLH
jgi:hypothetical protein